MAGTFIERTWSIALFGHFNPAITTTRWLADVGAIAEDEARVAVDSGEPTATAIRAGELTFEITLERFLVQTTDQNSAGRLGGVVSSVFGHLTHTPIGSLAMGLDVEWSAEERTARHPLLSQLPATTRLVESLLGPTDARSATLRFRGLTGHDAICHVTFEDSDVSPNGLYLSLVDEVSFDQTGSTGAGLAVDILRSRWAAFMGRADDVVRALVDLS